MLLRPGADGEGDRARRCRERCHPGCRRRWLDLAGEGKALDVLDHLRVVVGGEERFVPSPIGHGQPADKVRQPDVGGAFLLGVLMEVVVQLPGLVTNPEVVLLVVHHIMEEHVVRDEDLVHAPPGLEAVQVVLGGLALDMPRFAYQQRAGRVDALAAGLQHSGHRMLRQPIDFQIGTEPAQFTGNGCVAVRMPQTNR